MLEGGEEKLRDWGIGELGEAVIRSGVEKFGKLGGGCVRAWTNAGADRVGRVLFPD